MKMNNSSNLSTVGAEKEDEIDPRLLSLWFHAYAVVLPVILFVGMCGNTMNIIVLNNRRFTTVSYMFLRWLSFSDFMSCLLYMPWWIEEAFSASLDETQYYGAAVYYHHVELFLNNGFLVSSALLVLAITVERFIAVCYPLHSSRLLTKWRVRQVLVACYVLPFLLYIPTILEKTLTTMTDGDTNVSLFTAEYNADYADHDVYAAYKWVRVVLFKIIPIILVILLNLVTVNRFKSISEKRRKMKGKPGVVDQQDSHKHREDKKLMALLISVAVLYVLCLTPMAVVFLSYNATTRKLFGFRVFVTVANLLEILNSSLNFFLYIVSSADFRKQFRVRFGCKASAVGDEGSSTLSMASRSVARTTHILVESRTTHM